MIISYGIKDCQSNQNNSQCGYFRFPSNQTINKEDKKLSVDRQRKWLANIYRAKLSKYQPP